MAKYAGADWLKRQLEYVPAAPMKGAPMSPLGEQVADLLGDLFRGLYHWTHNAWKTVDWSHDRWISVAISKHTLSLCTWDFNYWTTLLLLCHQRCLRMEVEPAGPTHLRLTFYPREREGDTYHRHPTIQEAIARFEAEYGAWEGDKHG